MAAAAAVTVVLAVLVVIITISPGPVAAERGNHTCDCAGYDSSCGDCAAGRCCSPWGYCGASFRYCKPCCCDDGDLSNPCLCLAICPRPPAVENQQPLSVTGYASSSNETLVVATYDPNLDNVAVATSSSSSSLVGSATICSGPSSSTTVSTNIVPGGGECLQVINPKNGKQAMVRVINKKYCSRTSLALDNDAFQLLEDDDAAAAHLPVPVSYKYTHCT
ncbi:unnamed protein product [Linum trigynum]|uniref:Chitin-binding type-1 domain-containing protein n=1 Tax=Linum trigynum TaxID=586398 RepID=A0AAV2F1H0_9ROSI